MNRQQRREAARALVAHDKQRLRRIVVEGVGWGPKEGPVAFERTAGGWRVGNGVCVTTWAGRVPDDPAEALDDLWRDYFGWEDVPNDR